MSPSDVDSQAVSDDKAEARAAARLKGNQQLRKVPYAELLANFSRRGELVKTEPEAFIRAGNLFYVACSRAREHLAILFTTKLEPAALDTLREWVGESRITSLPFDGDMVMGGE